MVTIRLGEICVQTEGGNLLDILRREKAFSDAVGKIAAPCGGHGTCGKCRIGVAVHAGAVSDVTESEAKLLSGVTEPVPDGYIWRLACRCTVTDNGTDKDVVVDLWLPEQDSGLGGAQAADMAGGKTTPWVTWHKVDLIRPTLENPVSVKENLEKAGFGGQITAQASNRITALLTEGMDSSPRESAPVPVWIAVVTDTGLVVDGAKEPHPLCGAAIDVGTTTIAISLWRDDGVRLGGTVFANPSRSYGADVISRISYAMEHEDGTDIMCTQMRQAVTDAVQKLADAAGCGMPVCRILAGNAVMEHLYDGLNPAPIGKVPFYTQSRFGAPMDTDPATYLAPAAASYVGGDILMGAAWLLWDKPERRDKTILFLDLGTNGELGVYKDGKWLFAATAAGPAFEGAHIELGMPATRGAVTRIKWDGERFALTTVGDASPVGLCGSGILDGMWAMLSLGMADEYGSLVDDPDEWKAQMPEGLGVDEDGETCTFAPGVYLTQSDVRQIQTARAAIAAGVEVLCQAAGIEADAVDEVCLAGSFGHGLDVRSAAGVGLFPASLADRVTAVGNSSEAGCAAFWLRQDFRDTLEEVRCGNRYIELSAQPDFGDLYMEKMCFEM
ncbi:MAG: DUF4445 domain-containing protein [Clostridia bacterium]|nr:DUF4445 domain-containing protein [Clostridia bacterium]